MLKLTLGALASAVVAIALMRLFTPPPHQESPSLASVTTRDPFKDMTAAQHLAAAQEASEVDLVVAERHLNAIPADTYQVEVKALRKALAQGWKAFKVQEAKREQQREKANQQALSAARIKFAAIVDKDLINKGIEVESVVAVGKDSTTLRANYALCGRVFFDRFTKMVSGAEGFYNFGFKRIECVSSLGEVYYVALK